jgi:hypothetical protein
MLLDSWLGAIVSEGFKSLRAIKADVGEGEVIYYEEFA